MRSNILAVALMASSPSIGHAADPAAAKFGVRESIQSISLSPAGNHVAYVAPRAEGQASALYTVDLATGKSQVALSAPGTPYRLSRCDWVSENRLLCSIYAMLSLDARATAVSRLVAVDADGKNFKLVSQHENDTQVRWALYGGSVLDWLPGSDDQIMMLRDFIPEDKEKSRIAETNDGVGVIKIDTRTLATQRIENPRRSVNEYITDGRGGVRIMGIPDIAGATQMMAGTTSYYFRTKGSRDWKPFSKLNTVTDVGLNPLQVDPELDVAYAVDRVDGRLQLFRVALDGSGRRDLAYANPTYDVENTVTLGRSQRVIGASVVSDRRETIYFDPKLKALGLALGKALPGLPLVRFAGASDDGTKLLIFAGSDTDPGRYFVYDQATRKLDELLLARPQLEGVPLAPVTSIVYPAADGTMVPGYLTLPPGVASGTKLPAIVLPHGGPSARDEWGFDWLSQFFAHQGFAVLQPNFRGSSGYGDAWFRTNGFQSWRIAIGDVADAGRWLIAKGIADPAKLAIFGWSYGGYAALQTGVAAPGLFKAIVAVAPVTDMGMLSEQYRGYTDFAIARTFIGTALNEKAASPARNADAFVAPVLMFHGTLDRNVDYRESQIMDGALTRAGKPHELVTYRDLDHYLDDSTARTDMLTRSDAFLRASLHLPPAP